MDFLKIERPLAPPTQCIVCSTHSCTEGFVDTGREIPGYGGVPGSLGGRVYVCGWCVASAAKTFGFVDPIVHQDVLTENAGHVETIEKLTGELEQERDKQLVSITDLQKIVNGRKLAKAAG